MPTPRDRLVLDAIRTHGRLTREHIRHLFFRREDGRLASPQAVNVRLRKLVSLGYLEPLVVNGGRGSGYYAYGLAAQGRELLQRLGAAHRRGVSANVWHLIEIADFRVRLEESLDQNQGSLVEWLGEPALRGLLLGRRGWPVPDGLVHWRLPEQGPRTGLCRS